MEENQSVNGNYLDIYTRVSSDVQLEGESIQTQKREGIKKSKELGLTPRIWDEGSSSSNKDDLVNRPKLRDLLLEVDNGNVTNLFVWNTDRLSRNHQVWGLVRFKLYSNRVTLHTPTQVIDLENLTDNLLLGILKEISVYDNMLRSERSRVGKLEKVKKGYWKGGPPPFGYSILDKKLVVNKEESVLVVKMFEMITKRKTTNDIQDMMNRSGFDTRHGKGSWNTQTIRKMLQNELYCGSYLYRDKKYLEEVRVKTPKIISKELYNEVQDYFKKFYTRSLKNNQTRHFYLLRELLICECGSSYGGVTRLSQGNERKSYRCNSRQKIRDIDDVKFCKNKMSIHKPTTDELVWNSIKDVIGKSYLLKEEFKREEVKKRQLDRDLNSKKSGNFKVIEKRVNKEIEKIEDSITNLEVDERLGKLIGNKEKIKKKLNDEMDRLKKELESKREDYIKRKLEGDWLNWIEKFNKELIEKENLDDKKKKEFIENLVEKIVVSYNDKNYNHNLNIHFKLPIINDSRVRRGKGNFEIVNGEKELILNDLNLFYSKKKS